MADYDIVFVGSGFACSFFLRKRLQVGPSRARYLVLERGPVYPHEKQVADRRNSPIVAADTYRLETEPRDGFTKSWLFTIGFGGGSNCWWAGTPRMLPSDFEMRTRYGVGQDWPLSYDDLVPYYAEIEQYMQISGPTDSPFPKMTPYPLPPHRMTDPDYALKAAFSDQYFNQPTARASRPLDTRNQCCANGVCHICPVDAKFTIMNGMREVYADPRVTLKTEAQVLSVDVEGGVAKGVVYSEGGKEHRVTGDTVVVGANAIFNPYLLLRSGLDSGPVGQGLHEQGSVRALIYYDGVEGNNGSTSVTGHGYMLYDGEHRRTAGAALLEGWNVPRFRPDFDRWTQISELYIVVEDLPQEINRVVVDPEDETRPLIRYKSQSEYFYRGIERVKAELPKVLSSLPVERIEYLPLNPTEGHTQGTTAFGTDPATSVLDREMIHHDVRNLYVVGNSVFPTGSPANPTLTTCALVTRSAERM